jgi:hypothetical protein
VPVDFEECPINPASDGNEDLEYAITSIRRNGVGLKGLHDPKITFFSLIVKIPQATLRLAA